jgi:hypothetical protein
MVNAPREEDFDEHDNVDQAWLKKMMQCVARNERAKLKRKLGRGQSMGTDAQCENQFVMPSKFSLGPPQFQHFRQRNPGRRHLGLGRYRRRTRG